MAETKTYCAKHPREETSLRCSRCEAYICHRCAVATTVGYRCRRCGLEKHATYSLPLTLFLAGSAVGSGLGFLSAYLLPGSIGFFLLFIGVMVGGLVGQLVKRVIRRKSSNLIGIITAVGFALGALWSPGILIAELLSEGQPLGESIVYAFRDGVWGLLFAALAGGAAWSQIR